MVENIGSGNQTVQRERQNQNPNFLFERLPTNHHQHKIDGNIEDICKQCGEANENINHII